MQTGMEAVGGEPARRVYQSRAVVTLTIGMDGDISTV